jgi:regulator of sigma E protease
METILGHIVAFAIVFGILVFVHEFGHFIMAKLMKVRVEVFSWGYGKRLVGFKKGDTDYRVSLIPMGGYVKFSGEEALDKQRELQPWDFMAKKRWQRFLVLVMGSLMNILLAVVLVSAVNMVGVTVFEHQEQKPVIGWIEPGSPAERAGLEVGDEILSINKRITRTWNDVDMAVTTKPKRLINIEILRGTERRMVQLKTESKTRYERGYAGFEPRILAQVVELVGQSRAEQAGLLTGDVILSINSVPAYYHQLNEIIEKNPERELEFLVERDGKQLTLKITPRLEDGVGKIGIKSAWKTIFKRYGFFAAIGHSFSHNGKLAFFLINYIGDLMTGEASARQVAGPIEIVNFSYTFFRLGFFALMGFIAFVSLQLGIINLFPIPVFDGGQVLVLILEGAFRRDFSPKVKQVVMQIGFGIFILLIVFVILNDIVRRFPNGWESFLFWK